MELLYHGQGYACANTAVINSVALIERALTKQVNSIAVLPTAFAMFFEERIHGLQVLACLHQED